MPLLLLLQEVTAEMWESRQSRFPEHTPTNKEYYLLRSMFEEHFPSKSALDTVPKVILPVPLLDLSAQSKQTNLWQASQHVPANRPDPIQQAHLDQLAPPFESDTATFVSCCLAVCARQWMMHVRQARTRP